MPYMSVTPAAGTALQVRAGHHVLVTDLPQDRGGHDAGASPIELFVAALAACAAHQVRAFLHTHGKLDAGLEVGCHYDVADNPERVESIQLTVRVAQALEPAEKAALLRAIDRCAVHASIALPADLQVVVATTEPEPAPV